MGAVVRVVSNVGPAEVEGGSVGVDVGGSGSVSLDVGGRVGVLDGSEDAGGVIVDDGVDGELYMSKYQLIHIVLK